MTKPEPCVLSRAAQFVNPPFPQGTSHQERVAQAIVPATDVQLPTGAASAANEFEIAFDNDVDDTLPNLAMYDVELVP